MKTLNILVATLILTLSMTGVSFAWYEKNPDHITSLGISFGLGGAGGTADVYSGGTTASQDSSSGHFDISLDFRSPLSESLSIFGASTIFGNYSESNETPVFSGSESNSVGITLRVGLRIYFNR